MTDGKKSERDFEAACRLAVRLLGRRAHSRRELEQKLRRRGVAEQTGAAVLTYCDDRGYIDDPAACEGYCRELIRKGFGPRAIRQRLNRRGLDGELIQSVVATRYPDAVVRKTAKKVALRKAGQLEGRYPEKTDQRRRLIRFLTQRGFPADVIHEVLAEVIGH